MDYIFINHIVTTNGTRKLSISSYEIIGFYNRRHT